LAADGVFVGAVVASYSGPRPLPYSRRTRGFLCWLHRPLSTETVMGKYFIAWLLGVPGIVLVLIYLFMH
jgi:hypothetical protein